MNWKLIDLIGDYEEAPEAIVGDYGDLPIRPKTLEGWTVREDPKRYTRMIDINDETKFNSFILDILELQSETGHHARMTCQFPKIKLEVWTHTLDDITEVDTEWCEKANDILGDYV